MSFWLLVTCTPPCSMGLPRPSGTMGRNLTSVVLGFSVVYNFLLSSMVLDGHLFMAFYVLVPLVLGGRLPEVGFPGQNTSVSGGTWGGKLAHSPHLDRKVSWPLFPSLTSCSESVRALWDTCSVTVLLMVGRTCRPNL